MSSYLVCGCGCPSFFIYGGDLICRNCRKFICSLTMEQMELVMPQEYLIIDKDDKEVRK